MSILMLNLNGYHFHNIHLKSGRQNQVQSLDHDEVSIHPKLQTAKTNLYNQIHNYN